MALSVGQVVNNRYRIVRMLGKGGFGEIYRAWDLNLKAPCALKVNTETSPLSTEQFTREASMLANLSHAHLPKVSDYFNLPDQGQVLVMEFIEGEDLQEKLDNAMQTGGKKALPEAQVLPWIAQICDALAYLHNRTPPIIHRDIKPANIRITSEGRAVLVDFGIAKMYAPGEKTAVSAKAVTPGFSPPEQYSGAGTDARSDIYALGATLYNLVTGEEPPESVHRVVGQTNLVPPRKLSPEVSPQVENAIMKAMELSANNRFQRVEAMRTALSSPMIMQPVGPTARVAMHQETMVVSPGDSFKTESVPAYPDVGAPTYTPQEKKSRPSWLLPGAIIAFGGGGFIILILLTLFFLGILPADNGASQTTQAVLHLTETSISRTSTYQALPKPTNTSIPTNTLVPTIASFSATVTEELPTQPPTLTFTVPPPPTSTSSRVYVRIRNNATYNVNLYRIGSTGERHFLGWVVPRYYGEYPFPSLGQWTIEFCRRDDMGNSLNCRQKYITVTASYQEFSVP